MPENGRTRLTTFRSETGFFVFYSVLGFCFVCVPVEAIGKAVGMSIETLLITLLAFTIGSATLLSMNSHAAAKEEP